MVANSHAKRVLLNNPFPRISHFLETFARSLPDLMKVYQVQWTLVERMGREKVRALTERWEPRLPALQRGKWMTGRDMRRGVKLAFLLGLEKEHKLRILDIGCGTGFFLHVCKRFGHSVIGLDLPGQDMFKEWTSFFGIPRIGYRIRAFEPLPAMGHTFDLITMDSVTFDRGWSDEEWIFFLDDLRSRLTEGGRIYAMLKFSGKNGSLSNERIAEIFGSVSGFEAEFLTSRQVLLTRTEDKAG